MLQLNTSDPTATASQAVTRAATSSAFTSLQQRSLEMTESSSAYHDPRIVSLATPPPIKSAPHLPLYLGGAMLAGVTAATLTALARERLKRTFSSTRQIDEACGRCIAVRRRRLFRSGRDKAETDLLGEVLLRFLRLGPTTQVGLVGFDGATQATTLVERMARSAVESREFASVQVLAIGDDGAHLRVEGRDTADRSATQTVGLIRGRSTGALGVDATAPCITAVSSRTPGLLGDWVSELDRFVLVITRRTSRADVEDLLTLPHVRDRLVGAILV